ncbi:hypothetical protein [Pseudoduganella sp.]|uniref:hypothetical protein n=1 Tax=Pseudoduganella sp. TaxID=1880898 RepID=UPI0035B32C8A
MAIEKSQSGLAASYAYFATYGMERLDGLGYSYFSGLTASEAEEAWNFLLDDFALSSERITGLFNLDFARATALFKEALERPMATSPYPAAQALLPRACSIQAFMTMHGMTFDRKGRVCRSIYRGLRDDPEEKTAAIRRLEQRNDSGF